MSRTELEVFISHENGIDIVMVDGPVDSATIDAFKEKLDPVLNRQGAKVILDCQHLTYLNSRAIGLLVKYHRGLMLSRGQMAVCNLNSKLVRTLELLQLGKALFIHESREKALGSM
ncbi:MAG TPA: STAS domain-containing protein [Kiritimatiellia bacterium]|nr:STAS domain-containing protein [Kiritimatiellia bacterium]